MVLLKLILLTICFRMDSRCRMYIIELIIKLLNKRKQTGEPKVSYYTNQKEESLQEEVCEHVLRPVDSTGMVLACIKCGFVVNMNDNQNEGML